MFILIYLSIFPEHPSVLNVLVCIKQPGSTTNTHRLVACFYHQEVQPQKWLAAINLGSRKCGERFIFRTNSNYFNESTQILQPPNKLNVYNFKQE